MLDYILHNTFTWWTLQSLILMSGIGYLAYIGHKRFKNPSSSYPAKAHGVFLMVLALGLTGVTAKIHSVFLETPEEGRAREARLNDLRQYHSEQRQIAKASDEAFKEQQKLNCTDDLDQDKAYMAVLAHEAVTKALKAPSTAKFESYRANLVGYPKACVFTMSSYVDAQNSFGAHIRTPFAVSFEKNPLTKEWHFVDIKL